MTGRTYLGDTMQTTCPHCGSIFRITSEHLEMKRGQVRCGECQQVFNALLSLENYDPEPAKMEPPPKQPVEPSQNTEIDEETVSPEPTLDAPAVSLKQAMYGDSDSSSSNFKPLLWFIGILLLIIIAIVQVVYYQRYSLISSVRYQQQILNLCQILPCDEERFVSTSQIKLLERNIFTHPTRDKALMVTGSFVNQAPFSQHVPRLRISLSDKQGDFIASRLFSPQQYLADKSIKRLLPGKPVQFRLEIEDPGSAALAYEFEFF